MCVAGSRVGMCACASVCGTCAGKGQRTTSGVLLHHSQTYSSETVFQ